jgi:FRG domain
MKRMQATSLAEFVKAVEKLVRDWTPKDAEWYLQPWFRGHGDAAWVLEPGWYRPSTSTQGIGADYYNEATLLEKFKLRAPTYLERLPSSDWEWMFVMQHYGLWTRLLDWTESSLIALYFAIRDNRGDTDAAVWVLNPWWLNRQTFGDYVLFPADDERADDYAPLRPGQKLKGKLPLAITPVHASSRIAAQRGVFTIHGTEKAALDSLAKRKGEEPTYLQPIMIPKASVSRVSQELSIAGISESLIFPELSGLCREIKAGFFGD